MLKGQDPNNIDIAEAKKKIEANMKDKDMDWDDQESDEADDMPIFTSELAKLKEKELGKKAMDDDDMADDEDLPEMPNNDEYPDEFSDSEEEKDDYTIRKSDSLIVAATAEDDFSNLEVYVYDHKTQDLYVHHEIILGAMPLCLEWLK